MMLSEFISKHKNRSVLTAVMLIISIAAVIFTANDYALYSTPIAKVTDIEEKLDSSVSALINSKEDYYTQRLTAEIKNGAHQGETVTIINKYASSLVTDEKYSVGD